MSNFKFDKNLYIKCLEDKLKFTGNNYSEYRQNYKRVKKYCFVLNTYLGYNGSLGQHPFLGSIIIDDDVEYTVTSVCVHFNTYKAEYYYNIIAQADGGYGSSIVRHIAMDVSKTFEGYPKPFNQTSSYYNLPNEIITKNPDDLKLLDRIHPDYLWKKSI